MGRLIMSTRGFLTHREACWLIHSGYPNLMYIWLNKTLLWDDLIASVMISNMGCGHLLKGWPKSLVFLYAMPAMGLPSPSSPSPDNTLLGQFLKDWINKVMQSWGKGIPSNARELGSAVYPHREWMGTNTLCPMYCVRSANKVSLEAEGSYLTSPELQQWTHGLSLLLRHCLLMKLDIILACISTTIKILLTTKQVNWAMRTMQGHILPSISAHKHQHAKWEIP